MRPVRLFLLASLAGGLVIALAGRPAHPPGGRERSAPPSRIETHRPAGGAVEDREGDRGPGTYPADWFYAQRAFPGGEIPHGKFLAALAQAQAERASRPRSGEARALASSALAWTQAGPYNIGGRVTAIAAAPGGATAYLGSANGGVFKSVNSGSNWTPVFDLGFSVFSIGALALAPGDNNIVYVGTGEANSSVDSYDG